MALEERVYGILVVSASQKFTQAFTALLPSGTYDPVTAVSDVQSAKRELAERDYDFVVVNSPLPGDNGGRFAIDAGTSGETVALLLAGGELYDELSGYVTGRGVFTLQKPTSTQMILAALRWMTAARERARSTAKKALTLEEKMEEIRLVNRAKWTLIEKRGMDEPSAHRYIEKRAMDLCITKRAAAEEILESYK